MNLEDYFDMLHKMAKKNPSAISASNSHGITSNHQQDDPADDEDDLLLPEDAAES